MRLTDEQVHRMAREHAVEMYEEGQTAPSEAAVDITRMASFALGMRAVLALFEPETVSTAEELDALPGPSVITNAAGLVAAKGPLSDTWRIAGHEGRKASEVILSHSPNHTVTVLDRPEEDR